MFLWVPLIALVLWTVVFRYRRLRMYKLAGKIPGPSTELPVIGIAHTLAGSTEDIMLWLQRYSYVALESGGLMRGWLSHILYFIVTDPVDLEVILKSCLEKDDLHRFIRKLTGNGGIYAPVSIWRRRRKITVPAFSPKIVESFVEVFSEQSEKLTKQLSDYVSTGSFSIWPFVSAYTLDSVCESAMGVKINAQGNPNTPFLLSLNRFLNLACERIFHLWLQPDWLYKSFTKKYNEHQESVSHMHEFTDDVIQKKRDELRNELETNTEADQTYDLGKYQNKSFLDHLIKISGGESGFTNIELREEIMTLAIAGTDTSAVAIGFTLTLMAKYPEVQEKVYQLSGG